MSSLAKSPITGAQVSATVTDLFGDPSATFTVRSFSERPRDATLETDDDPLTIGRYRVCARIGAGGMGVVYSAWDARLERPVALKLIHGLRSDDATLAERECERLVAEAQSLARLSHPNVVQVYEVGLHEGRTYLAMELVEGPTLREWQREQERSLAELIQVYAQAGRGLAAAHAAGLAHRDFKPKNVQIGEQDGRVCVVDFGLAVPRSLAESHAARTITSEEDSASRPVATSRVGGPGTVAYMSPEQAFAGAGGALGDQFSFCVALFEAVYGQRPFSAETVMGLLYKLDTCEVEFPERPRLPVPRWLRRLLERGLSRDPAERFPTMDALLDELTRDRRRVWRRAVVAGLALGLSAVVISAVVGPTLAAKPLHDPDGAGGLADVWDEDRRAQLHDSFARVDSSWAEGSEAAAIAQLDDWAGRWLEQEQVAQRRRGASPPLMRCLEGQREQARVVVDALIEGQGRVLEGAVAAVDALPEPIRCRHQVRGGWQPERSEVEGLGSMIRSLADGAAQLQLGHPELARSLADAVLREAETRGHEGLIMAALRQRGLADIGAGRRERGLEDLRRARALATELHDDWALAELWVDLAWSARTIDNLELRADWIAQARSHVAALAVGEGQQDARHVGLAAARIELVAALDRLDRGDALAAADALADSLSTLEGLDAGDSLLALEHRHALVNARARAGLREQAEGDVRRALDEAARLRGVGHPDNARLWLDAGALALERGELELARVRLTTARDIRERALSAGHPDLAGSELALAQLELAQGELEAARRHAGRAVELYEELERERGDHDRLPQALRVLGQLESKAGNWPAATEHFERARALMPNHDDLQRALIDVALAKALTRLGEYRRAVALFDESLPTLVDYLGPERLGQLVRTWEFQAEALRALGRHEDADSALDHARSHSTDPATRARIEAARRI